MDVSEEKELYKRPYTEMLRRCDEAERKTLFVISQCRLHNLFLKKCKFVEQLSEVTLAHAEEKKKVSQLYKTNFV